MKWLLLIVSLPTQNSTQRMRAWRSVKASGAAALRDGVYLLPHTDPCRSVFDAVAQDVRDSGGMAQIVFGDENASFIALFDRSEDYRQLLEAIAQLQAAVTPNNLHKSLQQTRKLRKALAAVIAIDFFPGESQAQVNTALKQLETQLNQWLSPHEPRAYEGEIPLRDTRDYQGRRWATRARPWVDRLACAWLIKRFIDNQAQLLWLASPEECPEDALGFDFDGAAFTHTNSKVTFEVLLASFGLTDSALERLGRVVHFLDVGGVPPSEAAGLEQILWGLRASIIDDNSLLTAASQVMDALYTAFSHKN